MTEPIPGDADVDRLVRSAYSELPEERFENVLRSVLAALPPAAGDSESAAPTTASLPEDGLSGEAVDDDRVTGSGTVSALDSRRASRDRRMPRWLAAAAVVLVAVGALGVILGQSPGDDVASPPSDSAEEVPATTVVTEPAPTSTVPGSSAPLDDSALGRASGLATQGELRCATEAPSDDVAWACLSSDTLAAIARTEMSSVGTPPQQAECVTQWIRSVPAAESSAIVRERDWDSASTSCG